MYSTVLHGSSVVPEPLEIVLFICQYSIYIYIFFFFIFLLYSAAAILDFLTFKKDPDSVSSFFLES